jgi:hypothetical protein
MTKAVIASELSPGTKDRCIICAWKQETCCTIPSQMFVLTCSCFSSDTTTRGLTRAHERLQIFHRLSFTVLYHPLHSPDTAPSDFHLFRKLKELLREHHFLSDDEVKIAVKMWSRQQGAQVYRDRLMKLPESWRKSVDCRDNMLRSHSAKLQNIVQKKYPFLFPWKIYFHNGINKETLLPSTP